MAYELKDFLIDWFKAYHLSQMSEPVRARLEDMRSGDDIEGEDYVVITAANQAKYKQFMTKSVGDMVYLLLVPEKTPKDKATNAAIRALTGISTLKAGDGVNFYLRSPAQVAEYHRLYPVTDTAKIGEKIYLNDFRTGGQKTWFDGQGNLKTTLRGTDKRSYAPGDLPLSLTDLDPSEQRRFYTILRTAFRGINANPPKFADPDIPQPLSKFFGDKNIYAFSEPVLGDSVTKPIEGLKTLLGGKDNELMQQILLRDQQTYRPIFDKDYKISDLFDDINNKKYKTDPKTKEKLSNLFQTINTIAYPDWGTGKLSPAMLKKVQTELGGVSGLANVVYRLDDKNEEIDPVQFRQFQDPKVYGEILKAMYDPKAANRQSGFFTQIAENNGSEITSPMATVIENVNYDKVTGKYKDERTFWQQRGKDWDDWTEGHIKKFWNRALRHNYLDSNARGVVAAIADVKPEISPKDGLKKILEKKADIKKIIDAKYSSGGKGFDFLCETLEDIEKSGDMKNAIAGALKNGKQATVIAKEIIKRAAAQNRVGDAKVALETLAVMRYDIFTSEHGKEISAALTGMSLFDGTSFMKHDSLKLIINAAQKGFNLGVAGAFWTAVVGRNLIQHYRGKIPDADIKKLQDSMAKIAENSAKFKTAEKADIAWKEAEDKKNQEFSEYKDWDTTDDSTTPPTTTRHRARVSDLLRLREDLLKLDDGTTENKIEALENKLAAGDRARKKRDRAAEIIRTLRRKEGEFQKKESDYKKKKALLDAAEPAISAKKKHRQDLLDEKADLEKKIAKAAREETKIKDNIAKSKKMLKLAQKKSAAAKTPEEKKIYDAEANRYTKSAAKYQLQLDALDKTETVTAQKRVADIEVEVKGIDKDVGDFDDEGKKLAAEKKALDDFGKGWSKADQQSFIEGSYSGDPDDDEALEAHRVSLMETETPDRLFEVFGAARLGAKANRLKNSAGPRLSAKEKHFYEASLQMAGELYDKNKSEMSRLNELLADYDGYAISERVCHEEYKRLSEAKARGLEKDNPAKEYGGASSEEELVQELTWFWNAANGFESGVSVNDWNPIANHKNNLQTQAFKNMVAQKRSNNP